MEPLRLVEPNYEESDRPIRTVAELLTDAFSSAAHGFLRREAGLEHRHDEEDLHQARVAIRRIRSYLRSFRSVVDPVWASAVRADLGWYGRLLGEARNLDVLEARISTRAKSSDDFAGYKELVAVLDAERAVALGKVEDAHDTPRYQSVLGHLQALSNGKARFDASAYEDASTTSARILRRPMRNVRQAAKMWRGSQSEPNLHVLRIRAKELRYAAEMTRQLFGSPATRLASAAQGIQDRLGEHRDAIATAEFARRTATEHPSSGYAAGQIVVVERLTAELGLDGLARDLKKLRRRWREFERAAPDNRPRGQ